MKDLALLRLASAAFFATALLLQPRLVRAQTPDLLPSGINPGPGAYVNTIVVQRDGKVIVGGLFTLVNGTARTNLARLNSDGSVDAGWNIGTVGPVDCLALDGDDLYVAGEFSSIGGLARNHIAKVNTSGTGVVDTVWNPNADGFVFAMVGDGTNLYAGGYFGFIGGQSRSRIAKLSLTGTGPADPLWNPNANGNVLALAMGGADLYAGGYFSSIGGKSRPYLAKLSTGGTGVADPLWYHNVVNSPVAVILPQGTNLYIGGGFTAIDSFSRHHLARLSTLGAGPVDPAWNPDANGNVLALALSGSDLYAGGLFTTIGIQTRGYIAKVSTADAGQVDSTWTANANADVKALSVTGSTLYVGGKFSGIGGQSRPGLARFTSVPFAVSLAIEPGAVRSQVRILVKPIVSGYTYTMQFRYTSGDANWDTLSSISQIDFGDVRTVTDLNATAEGKLYRVLLTPP
ncbi:MAG TPA: delta-60 repeat domain-containing protein [Verrucomicrobiae bacterium]